MGKTGGGTFPGRLAPFAKGNDDVNLFSLTMKIIILNLERLVYIV